MRGVQRGRRYPPQRIHGGSPSAYGGEDYNQVDMIPIS